MKDELKQELEAEQLNRIRDLARLQWWGMLLIILSILSAILRPCLESYWDTRTNRIVAQEYAREWALKAGWSLGKAPVSQAENGK